jgi:hypothetical protein
MRVPLTGREIKVCVGARRAGICKTNKKAGGS